MRQSPVVARRRCLTAILRCAGQTRPRARPCGVAIARLGRQDHRDGRVDGHANTGRRRLASNMGAASHGCRGRHSQPSCPQDCLCCRRRQTDDAWHHRLLHATSIAAHSTLDDTGVVLQLRRRTTPRLRRCHGSAFPTRVVGRQREARATRFDGSCGVTPGARCLASSGLYRGTSVRDPAIWNFRNVSALPYLRNHGARMEVGRGLCRVWQQRRPCRQMPTPRSRTRQWTRWETPDHARRVQSGGTRHASTPAQPGLPYVWPPVDHGGGAGSMAKVHREMVGASRWPARSLTTNVQCWRHERSAHGRCRLPRSRRIRSASSGRPSRDR